MIGYMKRQLLTNPYMPEITLVPLTQGKFAIIDSEDIPLIENQTWYFGGGYAVTQIGGKSTSLHRLLLETPAGFDIDHINLNKLDNRRANLRPCTRAENLRNRGLQRNNVSGFKGVSFEKGRDRWRAVIKARQGQLHLGYYQTKAAAYAAYCKAAKEFHGEFARVK